MWSDKWRQDTASHLLCTLMKLKFTSLFDAELITSLSTELRMIIYLHAKVNLVALSREKDNTVRTTDDTKLGLVFHLRLFNA
jgi:hypothetical protein